MKKVFGVVLLICFLFTGTISYYQVLDIRAEKDREQAAEAAAEIAAEIPLVDMDALFRTHGPEEVIAHINGREVKWEEYFYYYSEAISEIENIFAYLASAGYETSWSDVYQDNMTFAEIPALSAEQSIRQYEAIESFALENGITLSEEAEKEIDRQILTAAEQYCGEDATEEDFAQYLSVIYLPLSVYRQMMHTNAVYQQTFSELYGEPTEDGSSEADYGEKLQQVFSGLKLDFVPEFSVPALETSLA